MDVAAVCGGDIEGKLGLWYVEDGYLAWFV